ncbi:MAG TPA: DUF1015 domain-containing protein [Candidatus Dormibacteraeota bacterium]|nr:DUF1015 domain-containing protein [Candidatus Dormibacteraeota bacterium]
MPLVRPFRGLGYALDRYPDLSDLVCPPYDVITSAQQVELLARHERNAVRLELPADSDPHTAAAATLAAWRADGTLELRGEPSVYQYAHGTSRTTDELSVHGLLVRVLLEPLGGEVRAHEHTLPGPKADRLAHLRATRTQVSPILAIYFDRSEGYGDVMGRGWSDERPARDGDAILHAVAAAEPDDRMLEYLSRQRLFLADGHHRYETALTYQAEVRSDSRWTDAPHGALPADWIMAVLVNAEREELEILPTHRLILQTDTEALRELVHDPGPLWQVIPTAPTDLAARMDALRHAVEPVFGMVLGGDEGYLLVGNADAIEGLMQREGGSPAWRRLDLAVLHAVILGDRLGIDEGRVAAGGWLAYTRSEAEARRAVAHGEAQAAILVRPTQLDQLAAVASAGDVMPQKSTYFYPKLLTGMVFNPLED